MNVLKIRNEMRSGKSIFDLPLRVTFYARVSTDKDEQLNSLENQVQYYTELIQSKPNWTYIPGYIDEGISGTSTRKRDSFLSKWCEFSPCRYHTGPHCGQKGQHQGRGTFGYLLEIRRPLWGRF